MLAASAIRKAIKDGTIGVRFYLLKNIKGCSLDVRLDKHFRFYNGTGDQHVRVYNKSGKEVKLPPTDPAAVKPLELTDAFDYEKHTTQVRIPHGGYVELLPGGVILGRTIEEIELPMNIAAEIQGRSRFARGFLKVHSDAPLIQPGIKGVTVLEISNNHDRPLRLIPKTRIAQVIFHRLEGTGHQTGRFSHQSHV